MSATAVTRHFVTLDGRWGPRQVHYRRAGQGPAVLLLHQSPQSSREMVELMRRWALHFTVIAPDTPGYGQSDPLGPAKLSIPELSQALLEFVDAIGLRRFGIYGYHTGSSIGLWLAAAHPERVVALAANGLVSQTEAEVRDILANYLPPLEPRWDGGHLAWLWGRVREQLVFYPWYERSSASRLDFDLPSAEILHQGVMEFMRAGDHYATAYVAAFSSRPQEVLPGLRVPLLVTATQSDPLRTHLQRLGALPAMAEIQPAGDRADAQERCLRHLLSRTGDPAPTPVATRPVAGRLWSTMLRTAAGQVRARLRLDGAAEPLVLVHGAGESSATASRLAAGLPAGQPLVIPDLPGHGESDPAPSVQGPSIAEAAQAVLGALSAIGVNEAILAGQGAGCWVALDASRRGSFARRRLVLVEPPCLDADLKERWRGAGLPSLAPQWHGGHLLAAWHLLRDGRLFFPWFERTRAAALRGEPQLDPRRLQLELRELLAAEGAWQNLWAAALDYDPAGALRGLQDCRVGAAPSSGWLAATQATAGLDPALGLVSLPEPPEQWLVAMLAPRA